jgi:hypothetical protein
MRRASSRRSSPARRRRTQLAAPVSMPISMRTRVDLPEPLGPINAVRLPAGSSRSRLAAPYVRPKRLPRSRSSTRMFGLRRPRHRTSGRSRGARSRSSWRGANNGITSPTRSTIHRRRAVQQCQLGIAALQLRRQADGTRTARRRDHRRRGRSPGRCRSSCRETQVERIALTADLHDRAVVGELVVDELAARDVACSETALSAKRIARCARSDCGVPDRVAPCRCRARSYWRAANCPRPSGCRLP